MPAARRSALLFVSPIMPDVTGSGLAMRAGATLDALARRYDVSLLVVPMHGLPSSTVAPAIAASCHRVVVMPAPDDAPGDAALRRALRLRWPDDAETLALPPSWPFGDVPFDVVHVYRLTALPFALPYLFPPGRRPSRHLDFDEAESAARRRQAEWYRAAGADRPAQFADLESGRCEALEREVLQRFDRTFVCSDAERAALPAVSGAAVPVVVPNTVRLPAAAPPAPARTRRQLLFVGTLGYRANADAVTFLCEDVAPRLRELAGEAVEIVIVGGGATARMRERGGREGVRFTGSVPDLAIWYRDAEVVVVPVRLGGGTRLKVLEAMSYGRPVVSTSLGIHGLDVRAGRDLLVADGAAEFATACRHVLDDRQLARRLGRHARRFVEAHHLPRAAVAALAG